MPDETNPGTDSVDLLTLFEVCQHCHNYFFTSDRIYAGDYVIEGGELAGIEDKLKSGQYYRIVGSDLNDGIHQYGRKDDTLEDESFYGAIWALSIPKAFLALVNEISAWQKKNGDLITSPYISESWGGYSYTKSSAGNSEGAVNSWQAAFQKRLNVWRKL